MLRAEMTGLADAALLAQRRVLCTADNRMPSGLPSDLHQDAAVFLNLDMAALGANPATFAANERGIAAEYVPAFEQARFAAGRGGFPQEMLKRPTLFLGEPFNRRYDTGARDNMRRALTGRPNRHGHLAMMLHVGSTGTI